jgi:CelD/BcsL family acetyltransferase involved in cellulose biosynthesis
MMYAPNPEACEGDAPAKEPLTARMIEDAAEWDAIRADWDCLYLASPTATPALDFVWLRCWWQIYGPVYGAGGLRIVTLWRGRQLVGALPLYLDTAHVARCLRFISTGEAEYEETCPDYLNLLHLPGEEGACARAAWAAVDAMQWDKLEFLDLPDDSPLLRWREAFAASARLKIAPRGACPMADIGQGFEAYLAQLSSKSRKRARQEIRKVERSGAVLEFASEADAGRYFDDLILVHQHRWTADGWPGCFSAPRFTEFHRCLVREWVGSGRAVLARLSYQGTPCVVLYGFVTGGKFDLYQQGVQLVEKAAIHSPGAAANLLLMAHLAGRGVTCYDFLRGASAFKESLTTTQRLLSSLECRRRSVRVLLDQVLRLLARLRRRIVLRASHR